MRTTCKFCWALTTTLVVNVWTIMWVEEGMKLELQPLKALEHANEKDAEISKKITPFSKIKRAH